MFKVGDTISYKKQKGFIINDNPHNVNDGVDELSLMYDVYLNKIKEPVNLIFGKSLACSKNLLIEKIKLQKVFSLF